MSAQCDFTKLSVQVSPPCTANLVRCCQQKEADRWMIKHTSSLPALFHSSDMTVSKLCFTQPTSSMAEPSRFTGSCLAALFTSVLPLPFALDDTGGMDSIEVVLWS